MCEATWLPSENISDESLSMSEASASTAGTFSSPSPVSTDFPDSLVGCQVIDPLRYPLQNERLANATTQSSKRHSKSVPLHEPPVPMTQSETKVSGPSSASQQDRSFTRTINQSTFKNLSGQTISVISADSHQVTKAKEISLSQLELTLPVTDSYEAETVDFPSSPTTFRTTELRAGVGVRLAEGEEEIQHTTEEEEDKSIYTATVCPPTGQVSLKKERPKSLEVTKKKRLTVTEELLNVSTDDDLHSVSSLSYHNSEDDDDDDAQMLSHDEFTDMLTPDDIDTPDELEESILERLGPQSKEENPLLVNSCPLPKQDEILEERSRRSIVISGIERRIDMRVIEPYKKVLSHGGYMPEGSSDSIIVFSACFLPDRSRKDYDYVMDHLFMYVLTTLDQLIAEDYILVYLHGATTRCNMPSFAWIKRCYQMIDRRLRKNLQGLYLVHPSFWVKTVVVMARPFVSTKFSRKLRFVTDLKELARLIPLDQTCIPARVKQYDEIRESLISTK